jgi:hypothetical protein
MTAVESVKQLLVLGCVALLASGCATSRSREASRNRPATIQAMRMPFIIGDTNVHVLMYQHGRPSPTFLNAAPLDEDMADSEAYLEQEFAFETDTGQPDQSQEPEPQAEPEDSPSGEPEEPAENPAPDAPESTSQP